MSFEYEVLSAKDGFPDGIGRGACRPHRVT